MIYITRAATPVYRQMTLEDFLSQDFVAPETLRSGKGSTITRVVSNTEKYPLDLERLVTCLYDYNKATAHLKEVENRHDLYNTFYIPKKSGGLRRIDAPNEQLMKALKDLKVLFETEFGCLHHTTAFAYVKERSTIDAVKRHQANESKWFGKYDLSDFFGSTTKEFVINMFAKIYPFSEVIGVNEQGRELFSEAIDLAFLDGGLPQGTPISPLITNVMMIPIDHELSNMLRDYDRQRYVYTRYADDFIISSKYEFDFKDISNLVSHVLKKYNAPFNINEKKTRYGSSSGANWNLGVMLNKDNKITIGHKNKRRFKAMLANYIMDRKNNKPWALEDVQVLEGYRNYYRMVEGEPIDKLVQHIESKFGVNLIEMIRADLR